MISKFPKFLLALALGASIGAAAQTGGAAAAPAGTGALPAAPSAANTPPVVNATGTKVGTINIEAAIAASNEGRRDLEQLSKKMEPKQTELKGKSDEIEALKKQLNTTGDKLNDEARAKLVKDVESKQKVLDRDLQDAREEAQAQQGEIMQRVLQKMGPVILKYAAENGYGILLDTSQQWPQGPVLWAGQAVDVTKAVVDVYNAQSGVPAPTTSAAPKAPTPKPASTTAKPTPPATGKQ